MLILVYVGWTVIPMIHCHYNGKETIAEVTNKFTRQEGGAGMETSHQVRYYTISFDGHRVTKRTTGNRRKVGDRLPVIYLEANPNRVVAGTRADGLWQTIKLTTNERNLAIAIGLAVFFLFGATKEFRRESKR